MAKKKTENTVRKLSEPAVVEAVAMEMATRTDIPFTSEQKEKKFLSWLLEALFSILDAILPENFVSSLFDHAKDALTASNWEAFKSTIVQDYYPKIPGPYPGSLKRMLVSVVLDFIWTYLREGLSLEDLITKHGTEKANGTKKGKKA
jgi:hypothetical protein